MGEGSGSHESAEKTPTVSPSTDKVGGLFSSNAEVGQIDFATTFTDGPDVGCPITRAEVGLHVSSSDDHFDGLSDITETVDSPNVGFPTMLSVFELSDMLRYHKLLGPNRFSPVFKLISDSKEDDILLLNWDNSMGSGKAENDQNSLDCVPLAQWDHYGV
nr:hypothetical protein CFP56_47352 [Quercus suber]